MSLKQFKRTKWTAPAALLVALAVVFPFLLLIASNFPSSDDFADYRFVKQYGFQTAFLKYYSEWGGRYFSVLLTFLLNTVGSETLLPYRLVSLGSLALLILLCYWLTQILHQLIGFRNGIFPAFTILLMLLVGYIPSPVELIYWFTGSWVYLPGLVMIAGWVLLAIGKPPIRSWRLGMFLFLPFCIAGTNEINIVLFAGIWLLTYLSQTLTRRILLLALLPFLAGTCIALLAPGNQVRQDFFEFRAGNPAGDFRFTLQQSIITLWHWGRDWIRSTPLLIGGIILFQLSDKSVKRDIPVKKLSQFLIIALLILPALTFPFFWGTGREIPAQRIMNTYWVVFVFLAMYFMVMVMQKAGKGATASSVVTIFLCFTLIAFFSYRSNWRNAMDDLNIAGYYKAQMEERILLAGKTQGSDTLYLKPLVFKPTTIVYIDLNKDPGHWFNKGFAYRYGIAAVKVLPDKQNN